MPTVIRSPNRAGEPGVQEKVETVLAPLLRRVRDDKAQLHATALRHWNIWCGKHDSAAYQGNRAAYLTTGRRIIEQWVAMLKRGAFPTSGKWFQVAARTKESEDRASTVQALFQRELTEYMAIRRKASPTFRHLVVLGTQPYDLGWRTASREALTVEAIGDGTQAQLQERVRRVVTYLGPTLRPVDFFRFYVWPTTVNDIADLDLCFEDFLQDPATLERLSQTPIVAGLEKGKKSSELGFHIEPDQWARAKALVPSSDKGKLEEQSRRLATRGFHSPATAGFPDRLDCEKGYWLVGFDEGEPPTWHEFILGGDDIPLRMRQVQWLSGLPTYLTPKFAEVWEEFWGYGICHAFDSLEYFKNDILNQGGDALTWGLYPIAAVDPDMVQYHTVLRMKPGAKWLVRQPRASVVFSEPPKESAALALQAVGQLVGLENDVGGVQPFAPGGKSTGKGRSVETLGGLQIIAAEGQLQVADVLQGWEDLFANPMLRAMYNLNLQCLDEPMLLNVEGVRGAALIQTNVTRKHLVGEFIFTWLASTYQYNQEVRTAQMNGMFQILTRVPPEIWAQDNTKVRIGEFAKVIYEEALQLPYGNRIFQELQPVRAIEPDLENALFQQGRGDEVSVSPADKHPQHLVKHLALAADPSLPPAIREQLMLHIQETYKAIVAMQLMMSEAQQLQASGQLGGRITPGGGGMPGPGGGGNGQDRLAMPDAPGRIAATASADDVARRMPRPGGAGPGGFPTGG